jgi:ribosomal subunit interface protein
MKINIQSLSFRANDKLIDFAEDKVGKLSQYSDQIMEAQVVLKVVRSATRDNKICEIKLAIPGNDLFSSKQSSSFEEAILRSSSALRQQLLTWKEKNQVNYT